MIRGGISILALLLALSLPVLLNAQTTGEKLKKKLYRSTGFDVDAGACNQAIDKQLLLGKDFQTLVITLEPSKGQLTMTNGADSRVLQLVVSEGTYRVLDESGRHLDNIMLEVVGKLPVMRFKQRSSDCFYYQVKF